MLRFLSGLLTVMALAAAVYVVAFRRDWLVVEVRVNNPGPPAAAERPAPPPLAPAAAAKGPRNAAHEPTPEEMEAARRVIERNAGKTAFDELLELIDP